MCSSDLTVNNAFVSTTITSTGNTNAIGGLTVTGPATFANNIVVSGNLTVLGNSVSVGTQNLTINDNIINLHTFANLAPLTFDDGRDIGINFHYYKNGQDRSAALVWANDTSSLEFYANGVESSGNTFSGTYGNVKIGSLFVANTTATSDTTAGAIISKGGIAATGNVASPNFLGNLYGTRANIQNLSVSGQILGSLYMTGLDTIYINGSAVATSAASFAGGIVPNYSLFQSVLEARGNIFANSQTLSTSTTTGALVVTGGAGIGDGLYVNGTTYLERMSTSNALITGGSVYDITHMAATGAAFTRLVGTNFSSANAWMTGGAIGVSVATGQVIPVNNVYATTGYVNNFSSPNVVITGGSIKIGRAHV